MESTNEKKSSYRNRYQWITEDFLKGKNREAIEALREIYKVQREDAINNLRYTCECLEIIENYIEKLDEKTSNKENAI